MVKKRAFLLALLCALLAGAFFVLPWVARASTLGITFGDSGSDLSYSEWTPPSGSNGQTIISSGGDPGYYLQGNATTTLNSCSSPTDHSWAAIEIPWYGSYISSISLSSWASGSILRDIDVWYSMDGISYTDIADSKTGGWQTSTFNIDLSGIQSLRIAVGVCWTVTPRTVGLDSINITYGSAPGPTDTPTPTATPNPILEGWNSPLRGVDQYEPLHRGISSFAGFEGAEYVSHQNLTVVFSNNSGQNVYSVRNGTVQQVIQAGACTGDIYALLGPNRCLFNWQGDGGTGTTSWAYWNEDAPLYLIYIAIADGYKLIYLVKSPQVIAGQEVTAGCLIGKTWNAMSQQVSYSVAIPPQISGSFQRISLSQGVALIQFVAPDSITTIDGTLLWVNEPSAIACAAATNSPCQLVTNSAFDEALGFWEAMPGHPEQLLIPWMPEGGIEGIGSVEQVLSLDSAAQYVISLGYRIDQGAYPQSLPQHVDLTLGTSTIPIDLESIGAGFKTVSAASYVADRTDGYYTVGFSGGGLSAGVANHTIITFLCVADANDDPVAPGGGCMVSDPTFSLNSTDSPWTLSSDPPAIIPPINGSGGGFAVIPDGGEIFDSMTLNPKAGGAEQDYQLTVTWRRQGVPQTDHSMSLDWSFDEQSGSFGPSSAQIWQDDTATISVETDPITASLYLTGDGSHTTEAAQVSMVCIRPTDTDTAPGYKPPPLLDTTVSCRYCIYTPTGDVATDLSEFVQWLQCQLYQLWECQAKILLRYIWTALVNILTFLGFFRLWLGALLSGGVTWANGNMLVFSHWLGGHFTNLGIIFQNSLTNLRSFTLISSGGAGFWDAIVAIANAISGMVGQLISGIGTPIIALLQQIVTGLFGLAQGLLSIIGALLGIAITWLLTQAQILVGMLAGIISALYAAFNHAAIEIPRGAPTCSTPGTFLYYPCLGFYILDNTIFSGPVIYIFPVFMGLVAWQTLLWGMRKVKAMFAI